MNKEYREETMGQRIRAQRMRLGMTQEELAEKLFLKKSTISYYENDKKEMSASGLGELARALHTTPDHLLGFEEKEDPFEEEAMSILRVIKDETVRKMLLKQMRALL